MFIELIDKQSGFPVTININHIITVKDTSIGCSIDTVIDNMGHSICVNESYQEVKSMLEQVIRK